MASRSGPAVVVMATIVAALVLLGPVGATGARAQEPAGTSTTSTTNGFGAGDGGGIIPVPGEQEGRPSNGAGFVVGLVLFVAWIVGGFVLFRRARRSRAAPS